MPPQKKGKPISVVAAYLLLRELHSEFKVISKHGYYIDPDVILDDIEKIIQGFEPAVTVQTTEEHPNGE